MRVCQKKYLTSADVIPQECTFLAFGADMELCEDIALYLAIIMCSAYHSLQVHARQPDGGMRQATIIA